MSLLQEAKTDGSTWDRVELGEREVAAAERHALGTSARVAVWPPQHLSRALAAVDRELAALDQQASRFREDSEISVLNRSKGHTFFLSEGLGEAMAAALAAASWTDGMVDPTVGQALMSLGYDRDFAAMATEDGSSVPLGATVPGWSSVHLDGRILQRPLGAVLDLGATAKGLGSDRAARSAFLATGRFGGVLVSLGGDVAVAGQSPDGGWPILVAEDPASKEKSPTHVVRLRIGGLATSSVACRRWRRGDRDLHHIIDPRTGAPAVGPWRTASVAAPTCVAANAASTALIVGGEEAVQWLAATGLPARLVGHDGSVRLLGTWPEQEDDAIDIPTNDVLGSRIRALRGVA